MVQRAGTSLSFPQPAPGASTSQASRKNGARLRLYVRRLATQMQEVAGHEERAAAGNPQAAGAAALARERLNAAVVRLQNAGVEQDGVGEAAEDMSRALAFVALAADARGLVALRAWTTLVAELRAAGATSSANETDSLLLSARHVGVSQVEVLFPGSRTWVRLPRLTLEDLPWRSINPRIRGAAAPAVFALAEVWRELPQRVARGGMLDHVVGALRDFSEKGRVPDTHRLPLYMAAMELRERIDLSRADAAPAPSAQPEPAVLVGGEPAASPATSPTSAVPASHYLLAPVTPSLAALGLSTSMVLPTTPTPPSCDLDTQASGRDAEASPGPLLWRRPRACSAPGRLPGPQEADVRKLEQPGTERAAHSISSAHEVDAVPLGAAETDDTPGSPRLSLPTDSQLPRPATPAADAIPHRGRSPQLRAPAWGHEDSTQRQRGAEPTPSPAPARLEFAPSRPSTPLSAAYSSLPSSCVASPRSDSPKSRGVSSPGSAATKSSGQAWFAVDRVLRPGAMRHGSNASLTSFSFPVSSGAGSEVADDEDWTDAAEAAAHPDADLSCTGARVSAELGAAGWRRLLGGWGGDGVGLGITVASDASGARDEVDVAAQARSTVAAHRQRHQQATDDVRERALLALGTTLWRHVAHGADPQAQSARCTVILEALADDELQAAWTCLTMLPRRVAEHIPAEATRRLLHRPPKAIDDGVRALAHTWLRRMSGSAAEAAAYATVPLVALEARAAGEQLARLQLAHEAWSAEPELQVALGRVLAVAGKGAPYAACVCWADAVAQGDGTPLVSTLEQVGAGHPLYLAALTQFVRRAAPAPAARALILLTKQKLSHRRGLERPLRLRLEAGLAALIDGQPQGWSEMDWDEALSWRLVEACDPEAQDRVLQHCVEASAAAGERPADALKRVAHYANFATQLQLAARLTPAHPQDVALAQATAKIIGRVARQQATEAGSLRPCDADAVVALVGACCVKSEDWQGPRREAARTLWRALDDVGYLLEPCAASGLFDEASQVVACAMGAWSLVPNGLWGTTCAVANLASPAHNADASPASGLVEALLRHGAKLQAELEQVRAPGPRSSLSPAVLAAARRLGRLSRAAEQEQARVAEAARLRQVYGRVARYTSLLASQAAYVLARQPLPARTEDGRARALDWTRDMLRLIRTRQTNCLWAGGELPLQALQQRVRAFAEVRELLERHVELELSRPSSDEADRLRLLPLVQVLAQGAARVEQRRGIAEAVMPYFGVGLSNVFTRLAGAPSRSTHLEARAVALQANKALHEFLIDHAELPLAEACTAMAERHRDLVLQIAFEERQTNQPRQVAATIARSFEFAPDDELVRAALHESSLDAMGHMWRNQIAQANLGTVTGLVTDPLRLSFELFDRSPDLAPLALALLHVFVDELVALGLGECLPPALLTRPPQGCAEVGTATPSQDTFAAAVGELIAGRCAQIEASLSGAQSPLSLDWSPVTATEARASALTAWSESLAPGSLGAGYAELAARWPQEGSEDKLTSVADMQRLDFALLDPETRGEVLQAIASLQRPAPALNHTVLQRMSFVRPLSPNELALAQTAAGYAGPYPGLAKQPLDLADAQPA